MEAAIAPSEAKYKAQVEEMTFGHLNPKPGSKQNGWIVWAVGVHGTEVIDYSFGASPEMYDDIHDFMSNQDHLETGVYRWDGWYKKFKNRNYQFQSVPLQSISLVKRKLA